MVQKSLQMVSSAERLTVRVPEAARMLSIGRSTLYLLIGSGDISTVKAGRATLVPLDSIRAYVSRSAR